MYQKQGFGGGGFHIRQSLKLNAQKLVKVRDLLFAVNTYHSNT